MITTHSDDPDVAHAADTAAKIIKDILAELPLATTFDYSGHILNIDEYEMCTRCTSPIAEAQAAENALRKKAELLDDETVAEHLFLAADFFRREGEAAIVRAELHNGKGTEQILNQLLGFQYNRNINDDYQHSHHQGA